MRLDWSWAVCTMPEYLPTFDASSILNIAYLLFASGNFRVKGG